MRKFLLLLSITSLTASGLSAQKAPDFSNANFEMQSIVKRYYYGECDSTAYSYDSQHRPLEQLMWTQLPDTNEWEPSLNSLSGYEWNDLGWQTLKYNSLQRIERSFDAEGHVTSELTYNRPTADDEFSLGNKYLATYDDNGNRTEEKYYRANYLGPEVGYGEMHLSEWSTYDYDEKGRLTGHLRRQWYNLNDYSETPELQVYNSYGYDDLSGIAVSLTQKTLNNETSEWIEQWTETCTVAKTPVAAVGLSEYYVSSRIRRDFDGDAFSTTDISFEYLPEKKSVVQRETAATPSSSSNIVTTYELRRFPQDPNSDYALLVKYDRNIKQSGMQSNYVIERDYDDRNRMVVYQSMHKTIYDDREETSKSGERIITAWDNLDRRINDERYVLNQDGDAFVIQSRQYYEYADNTTALIHYNDERVSSAGDGSFIPVSDLSCDYDLSVPFNEIATFVYNYNWPANFEFMPLKVTDNLAGTVTTYNYRPIASGIDAVNTSAEDYGVWPTVTAGELNIVAPEGVTPDVTVYSISGAPVARSKSARLSIDTLPAGIYIVTVNGHPTRIVKR